jgi:putative ATPase
MRNIDKKFAPLAEILRPKILEDYLGQGHLTSGTSAIANLIKSEKLFSSILWGPPGCGKTTFANLLAEKFDAFYVELSAVNSGVKDLRQVVLTAENRMGLENKRTILFIDEIHRYTKTQQDALLPYIEKGVIYLIGATTENPSFQLVPALLSRAQVIMLNALSDEDILKIIRKGYAHLMASHGKITIEPAIGEFITNYASGDARISLNLVENSYFACEVKAGERHLNVKILENLIQRNHIKYAIDDHYDYASALQKSIRGSDADAAIYWLAKMISGGEDPRFIARRLIITASEDIGLADNNALNLAVNAHKALETIGMPEGRIILGHLVAYLAKAKKSNTAYKAIDTAIADIEKNGKNYPVPKHLRDAHYKDASKYGSGEGYIYSHNNPELEQTFLPKELRGTKYLED